MTNNTRYPLGMADLSVLQEWAADVMAIRPPDAVIGPEDDPYMRRWFVIPRNPYQNIYLHEILRSDNDVPHDHPWNNQTLVIDGGYIEVSYDAEFPWKKSDVIERKPGDRVDRKATGGRRRNYGRDGFPATRGNPA